MCSVYICMCTVCEVSIICVYICASKYVCDRPPPLRQIEL